MKIEWNKVTWYSKLLAVVLFVLTFYVGFHLGRGYTEVNKITGSASKNGTYCFALLQNPTAENPDKIVEHIVLNVTGNSVTGIKSGTDTSPTMATAYTGTLTGTIDKGVIEAIYFNPAQASGNKELQAYQIRGDTLVRMRWPLEDEDDILVPNKLGTAGAAKEIVYNKEACTTQ